MQEVKFFQQSPITLGRFRCPASDPQFENTGPAGGYLIVFPREAVEIIQHGRSPVVANPNVLMFYNDQQEYRRRKISEWGDRCEFLGVSRELLLHCIRRYQPRVNEDQTEVFSQASRPVSNRLYFRQRALNQMASQLEENGEQLVWEEESFRLVDDVMGEVFAEKHLNAGKETPSSAHRDLAYDAQCFLSRNFRKSITLEQIAEAIDTSPFHLCRVFHRVSGVSLHKYMTNLRMRAALEWIPSRDDLTMLALELGYSSHSHFTSVFRKSFGCTPRQWRARI